MTKYLRGSVWSIDYSFNGERIRYAVGTEAEVDEEIERIRYEIKHKIHRPRKNMVFDNLLEKYLAWAKGNKQTSSYKRDQTSAKLLRSYFIGRRIDRITHSDVEQYQLQRRDGIVRVEGISRKDKVSNATVNREITLLKHMFKKAEEWGYLPQNPLRNVKLLKESPGRIRYVKPEEWQRLMSACSPEMRSIVMFARHTGLRRSEILNLMWSDIDWEQKQISIRNRKNNTSMIIPMGTAVYKLLLNRDKGATSTYVFPGRNGERRTTFRTGFEAACRRAGITDLHFHDLRHTFGSDLVNRGVDLSSIKRLMGHKNIVSTLRYAHPTAEHLRKAVESEMSLFDEDDTNLTQNADEE